MKLPRIWCLAALALSGLATFAQEHGRCHHPITGGTGDFAGATGVLRFKDDPVAGCSYYSGHLTLGG